MQALAQLTRYGDICQNHVILACLERAFELREILDELESVAGLLGNGLKWQIPDQLGTGRIRTRVAQNCSRAGEFELRGTDPHDKHELVSASPYTGAAQQERRKNQYFPHDKPRERVYSPLVPEVKD